jgi:hypothetical protein
VSWSKHDIEGKHSTLVRFLGILIDTARMEARLDPERLEAILKALALWSTRSDCNAHELQSLIGVLAFAANVVPAGRTFLRRMLATLAMAKDRKQSVASPFAPLNTAKR